MTDKTDLETRIRQFQMLQLPGQPQGMHMGTSYLVNDLWTEVKRLRGLLEFILQDEPNLVPRASSETRKFIREQLELVK